jgi:hypothetical protein
MFDITLAEIKQAEREAVKCSLCLLLGCGPVNTAVGEYFAARRTWDGAWQFGFGAFSDSEDVEGRKIGATISFNPTEFGKQEFLAVVDDGEVASTPGAEKMLMQPSSNCRWRNSCAAYESLPRQ